MPASGSPTLNLHRFWEGRFPKRPGRRSGGWKPTLIEAQTGSTLHPQSLAPFPLAAPVLKLAHLAAMSQSFARVVFVFTALFIASFFIWPVIQILKGGFIDADGTLTFGYLGALLADPVYLGGLRNSFLLACAATTLALLISLPLAVVTDRFQFPGKILLGSLVLVPMILPPFVGAIGIKQIFGQSGAFNSLLIALGVRPEGWAFDWFASSQFWGVALVQALSLYPIIYLNAVAALANIDPAMEEAAQNLGCTGFRRFRKITLPLINSGLFAGGTIVFIWSF